MTETVSELTVLAVLTFEAFFQAVREVSVGLVVNEDVLEMVADLFVDYGKLLAVEAVSDPKE